MRAGKILVTVEQMDERLREMGAEIADDYAGRTPILVCILKGAFMVMADLARYIEAPLEFDFMAISSYGAATKSSGVVRILKDLDREIEGRHVIVVEDIVDTGLTINYLLRNLEARRPASIELAAALVKEGIQEVPIDVRYAAFTIPPDFVIGYGLDYLQRFRNLPYVAVAEGEEGNVNGVAVPNGNG